MKRAFLYGTLVLLAVAASVGMSQAQMQMAGDVLLFPPAIFRGVATPAPSFYLAQALVEYGPGTFSAAGSEQSVRFFMIMEGELTFMIAGKTDIYAAGKSFSVPAGIIVKGSNEGRTAKARIFVSSLVLPRGEGVVTVPGTRHSSTPPRTICSTRLLVGPLPGVIDVIHVFHKYYPGFVTGLHVMNEVHSILNLEGTTYYEYLDGTVETLGPGRGGQMYVGRPGVMGNRTAAPAILILTHLATPGKPLFSPVR